MSHQSPAARVPAGVTTGGQFTASARAESPVELDAASRAQRQVRIDAAVREAVAVAESYGAADLDGVRSRAALGVNLTDYVADVRAAQASGAWEDGDVDTDELVTRGALLLEQTGAHAALVAGVRREQYSEAYLDGDGDPAALVEQITTRIENHLRLQHAVLHSPLAGSRELARAHLQTDGRGAHLVLDHRELDPRDGSRRNVRAVLTTVGTVDLEIAGRPVVGLGEHLTLSAVVYGTGVRASQASTAIADILRAAR